MVRAKITINTGVSQGDVLSPLLLFLFINAVSRYLTEIGMDKRINHDLPNIAHFNHILFTDDMTKEGTLITKTLAWTHSVHM